MFCLHDPTPLESIEFADDEYADCSNLGSSDED